YIRGAQPLKNLPFGSSIDLGTPQKGGYRQQLKEAIEGREKYAATLEMTKEEKEKVAAEKVLAEKLEELGKTIKDQNEIEMGALRAQHTAALKPFNTDVDAKRNALKAAEATGNRGEIDRAQLALNTALLGGQQKRDEQNKERETLKREHDKKVNDNTEKMNAAKKRAADFAKAPQLEYARNIQWGPGKILYRNTKAAENIIKNAGKSKEQKDAELLVDLIKKGAITQPGATPAPAPTATPSASGGTATP
ncbi:MAG: hypothetical protein AAB850_02170, partial [Patescibacteria group bacterium]